MVPRDTGTGRVLETMIIPALIHGGYSCQKQVIIGKRPSGKKHKIDVLAKDSGNNEYLISMKYQEVSGTAEEKIPYEVICLIHKMKEIPNKYKRAYLILGGICFSLRDFYIGGGLDGYIKDVELVTILSLESFIAKANQGKL